MSSVLRKLLPKYLQGSGSHADLESTWAQQDALPPCVPADSLLTETRVGPYEVARPYDPSSTPPVGGSIGSAAPAAPTYDRYDLSPRQYYPEQGQQYSPAPYGQVQASAPAPAGPRVGPTPPGHPGPPPAPGQGPALPHNPSPRAASSPHNTASPQVPSPQGQPHDLSVSRVPPR